MKSRRLWLALALIALLSGRLDAASPRVLPEGQTPPDARLGELTTLNGYFPFAPPDSVEAWQKRAAELRRQLLVSQNLWPMPEPTPLNAVVHGRVDRDDYTVERVYFESLPGFYVSGSLFRPKNAPAGKRPGILFPHGHWLNGRFHDAGDKAIKEELASGAEKFDPSGRYLLQALAVQMARLGCVVFHYDTIGNADSRQLAHSAGPRDSMNTPENWGFYSPQAELRLQTIMGLQTLDSIRALDFLLSLDDVDPKRIGVTGASGGGTQTFMLCALDQRPTVAFPAVMVSTAMQGGCTCENACYLRVGTGNIEIAALTAPRPLGMTGANDWTKEIATKGLPELQRLYALLGVPNDVMAFPYLQFGHNYNYVSRAAMYAWMNKYLPIGASEPIVERDFVPLSREELTVWDDAHPLPPHGDDYERSLARQMNEASNKQLAALTPTDAASLAKYREVVGGAFEAIVGRSGVFNDLQSNGETPREGYTEIRFIASCKENGAAIPVIALVPEGYDFRRAVIWLTGRGNAGLFGEDGKPIEAVTRLLKEGVAVQGADLFEQGEFRADGKPLDKTRLNERRRSGAPGYAGYTFGYNDPLVVQRAHDVLGLIAGWEQRRGGEKGEFRVDLVGVEGAAPYVALARAVAGDRVASTAVDTAGFRFQDCKSIDELDFLPGAVKYGDLPGLLSLAAPHPLWIAGEKSVPAIVSATYQAGGEPENVTLAPADASTSGAIVEWLLRK